MFLAVLVNAPSATAAAARVQAAGAKPGNAVTPVEPRDFAYYYRVDANKRALSAARGLEALRSVSIKMSKSGEYYLYSSAAIKKVSYKATLSYGVKGNHARLQRVSPNYEGSNPRGWNWKTIKSVQFKKSGKQSLSFGSIDVPRGRWTYRVTSDSSTKYLPGSTSKPSAVHLVSCSTFSKAPGAVFQTFSNPATHSDKERSRRSTALAAAWQKYICAAGKGATINVAIWMLNDDALFRSPSDVSNRIIGALDYVHKTRGVKISLIQDDLNGAAMVPQTEDWVRQITGGNMVNNGRVAGGRYYRCKNSCMSDRRKSGPEKKVYSGYMHDKFVTISKTVSSWQGKNAVAVGTSNWSYWQLRDYWNSFTAFRNEPILADRLNAHFDAMVASATRGSNTTPFDPKWTAQRVDARDRLTKADTGGGYSVQTAVRGQGEKKGDAAGNISVAFSPQPVGEDSILTRLKSYRCTPKHHTIRVGMYFASSSVGASFSNILTSLKNRGCNVKYVMSLPVNPGPGQIRTDEPTLNLLQNGLGKANVRCTAFMHSKNIMVDAVRNGAPEKTVWTAARNMDLTGLNFSDEVSVRITGHPRTYRAFLADWNRMSASRAKPCSDSDLGF